MSEETGNAVEVQEQPEQVTPAEVIADPAQQGTEAAPEHVEVSAEEARNSNYVPYDRFKEVIEQRNQAQSALDDRQRLLDYYATQTRRQQEYVPQQQAPTHDDDDEFVDPLEVARQAQREAQQLRAEIHASKQAEQIRSTVMGIVNALGFTNPNDAAMKVQAQMGKTLQKTGRLPDPHEIARSIRQQEIEYEKQIISRYKSQKTGGAARAASTPPPSAPVLESQPEQKAGWDTASKRIRDRLAGR